MAQSATQLHWGLLNVLMSNLLWQTTDVWTAKLVLSALVTYLAQYEACSTNIAVQLSQYVASFWRGCRQMNSDAALKKKSNIYPTAPESKKALFPLLQNNKIIWLNTQTYTNTTEELSTSVWRETGKMYGKMSLVTSSFIYNLLELYSG